jgi:hypothetical protein
MLRHNMVTVLVAMFFLEMITEGLLLSCFPACRSRVASWRAKLCMDWPHPQQQ